jgi:carboxylate-amine ligase
LIEELLEILSDVVDELGSGEEIEYIRTILKEGTSADRQLRTYQKTESLEAVVDMLAEETMMGL